MKPSFSVAVSKKRDILVGQLRARQLCRMLGFTPLQQARIVCQIFEVACAELHRQRSFTLSFRVQDGMLHVTCSAAPSRVERLRITFPPTRRVVSLSLPQAELAVEDIFWALEQMAGLSKPDLFAEIRQQNNDLLRVLAELQRETSPAPDRTMRTEAA